MAIALTYVPSYSEREHLEELKNRGIESNVNIILDYIPSYSEREALEGFKESRCE